ncbi:hypothetical protein [Reyranella sp.]|uniref:hypothetical protein n=1 Tax=Reyranella sp. TaxID=1929291 RepID=UPI003BAD4A96
MSKTTTEASGPADREPVGLREPFERLAAALEALARTEGAEAATAASRAARQVAEGMSGLAEELAAAAGEAAGTMRSGERQLEAAIRERPFLAVGIAAAAGFLLARLVRR